MPRTKLHLHLALPAFIATTRIAKALLGFGAGGGGLADVAFSAPDAPNDPWTWPTIFGSGGAGSDTPSPGEGDEGDYDERDYDERDYDSDDYDSEDGDDGDSDDDDIGPPDGHDSWFDFLDWSTWTTAKNLQAPAVGLGIEVLELGPTLGDTLIKVKDNHQRKRDLLNTDHRGTSHLTGGSDD